MRPLNLSRNNSEYELPSKRWAHLLGLGVVLILGLTLRMGAVEYSRVDKPLRADAGQYFMYAYNLRVHGIYSHSTDGIEKTDDGPAPDAYRSPGYPLFLAAFVDGAPTQRMLFAITAVQALLSTALIGVVYLLSRLVVPQGWALVVAFLTAISPHLVNANIYVLTESLFASLLGFGVLFAGIFYRRAGWWWIVVGVVLGLAALTRPNIQYFIIPLAVFLFCTAGRRSHKKAPLLLVVGFCMALAPWFLRNVSSLGVPGDDSLKVATLHHGMYPGFMYEGDPRTYGFPYRFDPRSDIIRTNVGSVATEIVRRFWEEPVRHLYWYAIGKPTALWSWDLVQGGDSFVYSVLRTPYDHEPLFKLTHRISRVLHWPLVALGLLGAVVVWVPGVRRKLSPLQFFVVGMAALIILYFTALHMIAAPFPRYVVPIRPFVYLMAVFVLWLGGEQARARYLRRGRDPTCPA